MALCLGGVGVRVCQLLLLRLRCGRGKQKRGRSRQSSRQGGRGQQRHRRSCRSCGLCRRCRPVWTRLRRCCTVPVRVVLGKCRTLVHGVRVWLGWVLCAGSRGRCIRRLCWVPGWMAGTPRPSEISDSFLEVVLRRREEVAALEWLTERPLRQVRVWHESADEFPVSLVCVPELDGDGGGCAHGVPGIMGLGGLGRVRGRVDAGGAQSRPPFVSVAGVNVRITGGRTETDTGRCGG